MRSIIRERKGDFTGVLFFIVSISAVAIFLIVAGYLGFEVTQSIKNTMATASGGNLSQEVSDSFDATINVSRHTLPLVWFIVFGGLLLTLFGTAYFIPTHPFFAVIFGFLLIVSFFVAIAMSNVYVFLESQSQFQNITSVGYGGINFFMSNLVWVTLVIGIIIMVIAYAKPRSNDISPA